MKPQDQIKKGMRPAAWTPVVATALLGAAASIAYGASRARQGRQLYHALPGENIELASPGGYVRLYGDAHGDGTPLLLIHSINASASGYEMRPLFLHYASSRPTYAIDLPGFGLSERKRQTYTPRIMADAIITAVRQGPRGYGT